MLLKLVNQYQYYLNVGSDKTEAVSSLQAAIDGKMWNNEEKKKKQ